jgi:hypothetical protein
MAITNEYQPSNVRLRITKGNGLATLVVQDWDDSAFQPTTDTTRTAHGLHSGLEADKVVKVKHKLAALGARGDYITIEFDTSATGTTTWAMLVNSLFIDAIDMSGVPTKVQHSLYSKYSHFPAPIEGISAKDLVGIDSQRIEVVPNVAVTADATWKDQLVRGSSDSRVQAKGTGATTAVTKFELRMKPNSDGVFIIPAGARIWAGSGTPT